MLPALYTQSSLQFWLARNARAYTSARSIGFCVIWVCISSSSSSVNFKEWRAIAEDMSEWRWRTQSKHIPPSETWTFRVRESKDKHYNTQKAIQLSQTCSGGITNTQLSAICWRFFALGEYNRIESNRIESNRIPTSASKRPELIFKLRIIQTAPRRMPSLRCIRMPSLLQCTWIDFLYLND